MILNFIKSIFHYELYILPIYLIIRLLYLRNKKINIKRELLLIIFASTIIMLLSQTIICEFYLDNGVHIKKGIHNNNFIPFKIFYDSYISHIKYGNYTYFIISLLGNIVLFIPYGFLLPSLYEIKGKHVVLLGLSLSLFIELSQLFLPRWTDIDDIILNTFGTFVGYQLYKYCVKIYNRE
jgi:glycopeptide antibiotics resistance protein